MDGEGGGEAVRGWGDDGIRRQGQRRWGDTEEVGREKGEKQSRGESRGQEELATEVTRRKNEKNKK